MNRKQFHLASREFLLPYTFYSIDEFVNLTLLTPP